MNSPTETNHQIHSFISDLSANESYDLSRVEEILNFLDNPQDKINVIHVAGTSGKTSTCYYISSLLMQSGYKVGLTASPHTENVNERVQINLTPINAEDFSKRMSDFINLLSKLSIRPTYFELFICFAYWYFEKQKVDYAVVETGLGGLLDATNSVNSSNKVCVITDIGLDHTEILGDTLTKISEQKAGIIQPKNDVFINKQPDEILEVFRKKANSVDAKLNINHELNPDINLPAILKRNWSLAIAVNDFILKKDNRPKLNKKQIDEAAKVVVPGRIECFKIDSKKIIIDGAHNEQKMTGLIKSIKPDLEGKKVCTILAVGENKKQQLLQISRLVSEISDEIILTSFYENQDYEQKSLDPDYLESYFADRQVKKILNLRQAIDSALESKNEVVLITGSLYLIGNARKILKSKT